MLLLGISADCLMAECAFKGVPGYQQGLFNAKSCFHDKLSALLQS